VVFKYLSIANSSLGFSSKKRSTVPSFGGSVSVRLVALVVLQMHLLKENIPPGHPNFAVQYQIRRTRHPSYLLLHTNCIILSPPFFTLPTLPTHPGHTDPSLSFCSLSSAPLRLDRTQSSDGDGPGPGPFPGRRRLKHAALLCGGSSMRAVGSRASLPRRSSLPPM
jgi:hypothetical protein